MTSTRSFKKMSRRKFIKLSAVAAGAVLLPNTPRLQAAKPSADLVLKSGKVITLNRQGSVVQAIAVRQGIILDAGDNQTIDQYISRQTRVIDLKGKTITPGLIDSHAHLPPFGLRESHRWVKLQGMESKEEILEALARRAKGIPKGQWIAAWGVEANALTFLTKEDLDRVSGDHPMLVTHTTGQWGFANSLALKIAGIDSQTPNPPGSKIAMKLFGKGPTGLLIHYPALYLVRKHMPPLSDQEAEECILSAANLYVREGVTAVHDNFFMISDIGVNPFARPYLRLIETGRIPVRVKIWPYLANVREAAAVMGDLFSGKEPIPASPVHDFFVLRKEQPTLFSELWGGVKIAIDGSGPTALWYGNPRGLPLHSTSDVHAMVKLFHLRGLQISAHAVGDQAVDLFLDALEAAQKDHFRRDARHRIEHAILPRGGSLERIGRIGAVVSTHPQFIYAWGDKWLMPDKEKSIPLNSYLQAGIPIAFGADPPAYPFYQPQMAIWQAKARTTKSGLQLDPAERISIDAALKVQAMGSAYAGFQEKSIGSLEKGKCADMVVWDRDISSLSEDGIKDIKAMMTFLNGKIVYERKDETG
jgi:predicted amidohydrolase YtcJ